MDLRGGGGEPRGTWYTPREGDTGAEVSVHQSKGGVEAGTPLLGQGFAVAGNGGGGTSAQTAGGGGRARQIRSWANLLVLAGVLEVLTGTPLVVGVGHLLWSPPGC